MPHLSDQPSVFLTHSSRVAEFRKLKDEGWQWQEVDPTADGATFADRLETSLAAGLRAAHRAWHSRKP